MINGFILKFAPLVLVLYEPCPSIAFSVVIDLDEIFVEVGFGEMGFEDGVDKAVTRVF